MSFLDAASWSGKLFSDGWRASSGGVRTVVEPATGADLGTVGLADPSDIERAALSASKAQPGWASTSFQERAAVLRRAGDLFLEHADEIATGSYPGEPAAVCPTGHFGGPDRRPGVLRGGRASRPPHWRPAPHG